VIAAGGGAGVPLPSPEELDMPDNTLRTDGIFMLEQNDLELHNILGKGNFCSVIRGTYQFRSKVIDVAVKKVRKTVDADTEVSFAFFEGT